MLISVEPGSTLPLFEQIAAAIRTAVVRGDATTGERLPAARDLARALDLNVHTVLHAYHRLREEGLVELRRGRGATIAGPSADDYARLRSAIDAAVAEAARVGLGRESLSQLILHEKENP